MALLAAQGCDHTVLPQDRLKSFLLRAKGVTIPGLSEDYVFDDFEFALDLLAMISYSRADRTR